MGFSEFIHNFLQPRNAAFGQLNAADQQRMDNLIAQSDKEGAELAQKGLELVEQELTGVGVNIQGIKDTIQNIQDLLDEIDQPKLDPADYKTKVIIAKDVLEALDEFRLDKLKQFYVDKIQDITDETKTLFNGVPGWFREITKMQGSDVLTSVLDEVNSIVEILLDVAELFHFVDDLMRDTAALKLQQNNPEFVAQQKHRTRKES